MTDSIWLMWLAGFLMGVAIGSMSSRALAAAAEKERQK